MYKTIQAVYITCMNETHATKAIQLDLTARRHTRNRDIDRAIRLAKKNGWGLSIVAGYNNHFALKFTGETVDRYRIKGFIFA